MRRNEVRARWASGGVVMNAWLSIPSPYAAEIMGHQGFDAVTVDLQHGMIGFDTAVAMFQALSATPAVPMARVSRNDPHLIMQLLDAGAYGIICPMISTAQEARDFVAACRYPPAGNRSFGPARGVLFGGADYFAAANGEIVTMAMIETREGLDNLDAILAVDGLDGIYVGPNDLALALGCPPSPESDDPHVVEAVARICRRTRDHGKATGIFCSSGTAAAERARQGFALVTPGNDANLLSRAAREAIAAARGGFPEATTPKSGY